MTPINNLKQWFRNGLKPTQEQFWAWMDSYWHKGEKIPQASIEGLDKSLENKAETSAVEAKANKDATGLSDDNVAKWKEALGVGELPSNIAKIDEGDKVGNAYTKEQVVELLGEKLDAPSGEGTSEDYPYVVGVNAENESVKLPAGDLGKNLANSKPTSVAGAGLNLGAIWDIDTNGFPLRIRGLDNKKSDPTHNLKVKMNTDGQLSVSDEMDVVVNIPDKFSSTASIGSMTINVNHIFPNPIPPTLNFAEEIKEIMRQYPSYEFTPITKSMWQIQTKNNLGLDRIILGDDNTVLLQGSTDFNGMNNELVASVFTPNLRLPRDKNWILKFDFETLQSRFGGLYFGVCRYGNNNNNNNNNNVVYGFESGGWDFHGQELKVRILLDSTKTLPYSKGSALLIKVGETITQVIYCYDTNTYKTVSATTELGDYVPCLNLLGADGTLTPNRRMKAKAYYKILD